MNETDIRNSIFEPLLEIQNQDNSSREIIDKINSKNAKKVAVGLIVFFIFYHSYIHVVYGTYAFKCKLLNVVRTQHV